MVAAIKSSVEAYRLDASKHNAAFFFMTPQLAQWAGSGLPFLKDAMQAIFTSPSSGSLEEYKYSIAAVVDKIPSSEKGSHEGISMCITDMESIKIKPTSATTTVGRMKSTAKEEQPLVSFAARKGTLEQQIGIRLANTLFLNGMPRTLLASQWLMQPNGEAEVINQSTLSNCRVFTTKEASTKSRLALLPVTSPRTVAGCVGNILSRLHRNGPKATAEPASLELERIFPQYLEQHELKAQAVGVWALVRPKDMCATSDVNASLESGARLFRVLSGGGGWGNKQGLLSLDPECDLTSKSFYDDSSLSLAEAFGASSEEQEPEMPSFSSIFGGSEFPSLGNTVAEGETVQFFVGKLDDESLVVRENDGLSSNSFPRMTFGVTPKNNEFEGQLRGQDKTTTSSSVTKIPNFFGALTEECLTFVSSGDGATHTAGGRIGTKIDVPGSRLSIEMSQQ